MTNSIVIAALTAKFGAMASQIAALCMRAPNPAFEIETLLGVYEMPKLPRVVKMRDGDATLTLIAPERHEGEVVAYQQSDVSRRFFKDEDHAKRCMPHARHSGESSNYNGNYPLELEVKWVEHNRCSIGSWLGYSVVEVEEEMIPKTNNVVQS